MATTWKEALRELLVSSTHLAALVDARRVRHGYRPAGDDYPAVTFFALGVTQGHTLTAADGLPLARVQIDCWGRTGAEADQLREAVRLTVDGFRGDMSGVFVQSCLLDDGGRDEYLPPQDGSDRGVHQVTLDLRLSFEETVPTF